MNQENTCIPQSAIESLAATGLSCQRPYTPPVLLELGALAAITQGSVGNADDVGGTTPTIPDEV